MNKKVIFLDIDGTLTQAGSNIPPESALLAISSARQKGHEIYLCTGRNYAMLSPLLKYDFDGFIGSAGGYVSCGENVIFDCPMTEEQSKTALKVLEDNGIFRTIECLSNSYTDDGLERLLKENSEGNSELLRWRAQLESSLNIEPISGYKGQAIYKIVFMCNELSQLEQPKAKLGNDFHFVVQEVNKHGIINGEIVNRKFDKGQAILRVCEHLHIDVQDTIGFGDSMNDLEMMETVGYSVCMENGSQAIKDIADYVCPDVSHDGIEVAFKKLQLI